MKESKTISQALQEGKERLKAAGKDNYVFEAELLMMDICSLSRVGLFTQGEEGISPQQAKRYESYLSQREGNRPLQYILGQCEFMGLPFFVGEGVLIPRSDTEVLVEGILEVSKQEKIDKIMDVGTGSGCIPICLAHYGKMEAYGVDISPKALDFAKKNGENNKVNVRWIESDLFSAIPDDLKGTFDAIVSNPPYIAKEVIEGLMPEVRDFEPRNALDGGEDGLDFYRSIIADSRHWLRDGGWLFFEIGYDQGQALLSLMEEAGFCKCMLQQDLAGLDRVVFGKLEREFLMRCNHV
ncbi:peptide chain release factor N(5)-glutamine methyltransferase [Anaerotignum sp. MB30-C6]|uniref:peptide chain release factor N(5)-glutamine methyltransferase n=1 Tax=Anaerotignum sp. MB30-C6 TaxID=3070814 RepID=UPI0027DC4B6F|nr:peptide chain release factor N(5)-glutamine methyltransferase [Anaerotignum sp. MB30-C6]WMI81028.1 peptide chain release factor N(5)-glutamine methyltransferase [Anaerotignum sp. MB30-C6]